MSMDFDYKSQPLQTSNRSYITTLLLAFFLGPFGVHRFYTGYVGIGVAQLLLSFFTGLGCLWAFVDLIAIALNKYLDADGNELEEPNTGCGLMVLISIAFSFIAGILLIISIIGSASAHYN